MEEKHRFVSLADTGKFSVTELCTEFKVSRRLVERVGPEFIEQAHDSISVRQRFVCARRLSACSVLEDRWGVK